MGRASAKALRWGQDLSHSGIAKKSVWLEQGGQVVRWQETKSDRKRRQNEGRGGDTGVTQQEVGN